MSSLSITSKALGALLVVVGVLLVRLESPFDPVVWQNVSDEERPRDRWRCLRLLCLTFPVLQTTDTQTTFPTHAQHLFPKEEGNRSPVLGVAHQ